MYDQTGNTTGKRVSHIGLFGFGEFLTLDLAHFVTKGFTVAFDTHGGDDYLGENLGVFRHCHIECLAGHFVGLGGVSHVGELQFIARFGFDRKLTIHIGNGTDGGSFDEHTGADERTVRVFDRTRNDVLRERQACSSHEENYKAKHIPEIGFHGTKDFKFNVQSFYVH